MMEKILLLLALFSATQMASADALQSAIGSEKKTLSNAIQSQKKVDRLDNTSRQMLEEYRRTLREIDSLKSYTKHLQALIDSQRQERESLEKQIQEIAVAEREIVPLMTRMVDSLAEFVKLDTQFLPEERSQRVQQLQALLTSAEVSDSEKFRRILEAYQIETDYARTIEAYRANLTLAGESRPVDFLRLGRAGLFYLTLDGRASGFWNPKKQQWETLSDDYRRSLQEGLRIARKQAAPNLLVVPVPTAEPTP